MSSINLTWSIDGGADSYSVYRSETTMSENALPAALATGVTAKSYSDSVFEYSKTYYYRVSSVKGGIEKISTEITLTTPAPPAPIFTARYWRVLVKSNNGASYVSLSEIFLVNNSVDLVTSGKAYNQSSYAFQYYGSYCFNGAINGSNYWATHSSSIPAWVSIDMGADVTLDRVDLAVSTIVAEGPKDFDIQNSSDGVNWNTVKSITGKTDWVLGSRIQFAF